MSQIEPQEDVDYDDVFESILTDAKRLGFSDEKVWDTWKIGIDVQAKELDLLDDNERAARLEQMIDRMSEKNVDLQRELSEYKELYNNTASKLNAANYLILQIKGLLLATKA
jgi:hypothetical protein